MSCRPAFLGGVIPILQKPTVNVHYCESHRLVESFCFDKARTCRSQIPSVCRRSECSLIVVEMVFPYKSTKLYSHNVTPRLLSRPTSSAPITAPDLHFLSRLTPYCPDRLLLLLVALTSEVVFQRLDDLCCVSCDSSLAMMTYQDSLLRLGNGDTLTTLRISTGQSNFQMIGGAGGEECTLRA